MLYMFKQGHWPLYRLTTCRCFHTKLHMVGLGGLRNTPDWFIKQGEKKRKERPTTASSTADSHFADTVWKQQLGSCFVFRCHLSAGSPERSVVNSTRFDQKSVWCWKRLKVPQIWGHLKELLLNFNYRSCSISASLQTIWASGRQLPQPGGGKKKSLLGIWQERRWVERCSEAFIKCLHEAKSSSVSHV